MPSIDYKAAADVATMDAVLRVLGWNWVEKRRKQVRGHCPVHKSSGMGSPAFVVTGEQWWCVKCKRGGGPLTLFAAVLKLPIYEATRELFRLLGKPCPFLPRGPRRPRDKRPANREEVV